MNSRLIFIAVLAIYSFDSTNGQILQVTDNLLSATNQWSQLLNNTWNSLRNFGSNGTDSHSRIHQIQSNLTNWRNILSNGSSEFAQDLVYRLQNMSQHLNTIMRERANNDQNLVHNLYDMIINKTRNGTNDSIETLRDAFTTATQTMAENYAGLANSSLQLASDMRDKGTLLFNNAMIRAGNDTNRAVIAVNAAVNAIRNSSESINGTVQQMVSTLSQNVQRLSSQLRNLVNQTPSDGIVENSTHEFRQKAEQSLQKLMWNLNQLRNSLGRFATNATTDSNTQNNDIDVIQTTTLSLSNESEALQNQITTLRNQG